MPEKIFLVAICSELCPIRKPGREFDNPVVQERGTDFQATGHAGAVDLRENVIGQIALEVQVLHLAKHIGIPDISVPLFPVV